MVFNNCIEAYESLKKMLMDAEQYNNNSCRSREDICYVKELIGVRFEILDTDDVFDLIKKIEPLPKDRLNYIAELSDEFVNDKKIIYEDKDKHYTYNNRIIPQKKIIINNIKDNKSWANRQAFLGIWSPCDDTPVLGKEEVPCSIGYQFLLRNDKLHMIYFMRSLDLNVWPNDVYLSRNFQDHMAAKVDALVGRIIFNVGSLHIYIRRNKI